MHSAETKEKMRLAATGKKHSPETRIKMALAWEHRSEALKAEIRSRFKKVRPDAEAYRRAAAKKRGDLNPSRRPDVRVKISQGRRRYFSTVERTDQKLRLTPAMRKWRMRVLVRDGFICQECRIEFDPSRLTADHIKPFALFPDLIYALDNGRTLCADCHRKTPTYGTGALNGSGCHGDLAGASLRAASAAKGGPSTSLTSRRERRAEITPRAT